MADPEPWQTNLTNRVFLMMKIDFVLLFGKSKVVGIIILIFVFIVILHVGVTQKKRLNFNFFNAETTHKK